MDKITTDHKKTAGKVKEIKEIKEVKKPERYVAAIGRRKTAVASVRLSGGHGKFSVNGKTSHEYFKMPRLEFLASVPLLRLKLSDKYDVSAKVGSRCRKDRWRGRRRRRPPG